MTDNETCPPMDEEAPVVLKVKVLTPGQADSVIQIPIPSLPIEISLLRELVSQKSGITPVASVRLIFQGRFIRDGENTDHYGIQADSVLHLVPNSSTQGQRTQNEFQDVGILHVGAFDIPGFSSERNIRSLFTGMFSALNQEQPRDFQHVVTHVEMVAQGPDGMVRRVNYTGPGRRTDENAAMVDYLSALERNNLSIQQSTLSTAQLQHAEYAVNEGIRALNYAKDFVIGEREVSQVHRDFVQGLKQESLNYLSLTNPMEISKKVHEIIQKNQLFVAEAHEFLNQRLGNVTSCSWAISSHIMNYLAVAQQNVARLLAGTKIQSELLSPGHKFPTFYPFTSPLCTMSPLSHYLQSNLILLDEANQLKHYWASCTSEPKFLREELENSSIHGGFRIQDTMRNCLAHPKTTFEYSPSTITPVSELMSFGVTTPVLDFILERITVCQALYFLQNSSSFAQFLHPILNTFIRNVCWNGDGLSDAKVNKLSNDWVQFVMNFTNYVDEPANGYESISPDILQSLRLILDKSFRKLIVTVTCVPNAFSELEVWFSTFSQDWKKEIFYNSQSREITTLILNRFAQNILKSGNFVSPILSNSYSAIIDSIVYRLLA